MANLKLKAWLALRLRLQLVGSCQWQQQQQQGQQWSRTAPRNGSQVSILG